MTDAPDRSRSAHRLRTPRWWLPPARAAADPGAGGFAKANPYDTPRRDDLQGLRALAVLAVVGYHAGLPWVPGGFVGVDIFFVLSGFLITRLLLREVVATGRVDLPAFWARRARRLLPNAALTLLAILALTYALLPAYRWADIGQDVGAAALFFSNIRFASIATDYFHLGDPPSPVLHFWSLNVEEQFYMVWPPLIALVAWRTRRRSIWPMAALLVAAAIVSFAINLETIDQNQPAAFFLSQSRIWQLACGGLVGMGFHWRERLPRVVRAAVAWLGLAGMLAAIATLNDDGPYPGLLALLPTLATAGLLLGLDSGGYANAPQRWLSTLPLRWLGDRSYALYLWHWPAILFVDALWPATPLARAGAVAVAVAMATLSYAYVEQPGRRLRHTPLRILRAASVVIAFVVAAGWTTSRVPLPPASVDRSAAVAAADADDPAPYSNGCHVAYDVTAQPPCLFGDIAAARRVVLFGDSHAAQWFGPLSAAARRAHWQLVSWTKSGCPAADVTIWYQPRKAIYQACDEWRRQRMDALIGPDRPDAVVLADWSGYGNQLLDPTSGTVARGDKGAAIWQRGLTKTVGRLLGAGVKVVLMVDTPTMYSDYRTCIARSTGDCGRPLAGAISGLRVERNIASQLPSGVLVVDLSDQLCNRTMCPAVVHSMIAYRDNNHLTNSFAATLQGSFDALLARLTTMPSQP